MFYRKKLLVYCIFLSITILSSLTMTTITSNKSNDLLDGENNLQKINGESDIQVNGLEITTVFPNILYTERSYDIEWTYETIISDELVNIYLLNDDDIELDMSLASSISNDGQFEWEVPWTIDLADNYYFYIYCIDDLSIYDSSNSFSIADPPPTTIFDALFPLMVLGFGLFCVVAVLGTVFIFRTRQTQAKKRKLVAKPTTNRRLVAESTTNRPLSQSSFHESKVKKDPNELSDEQKADIARSMAASLANAREGYNPARRKNLITGFFIIIFGFIFLIASLVAFDATLFIMMGFASLLCFIFGGFIVLVTLFPRFATIFVRK